MENEPYDSSEDRNNGEAEIAGDRTDDYGLRRRLVGTFDESSIKGRCETYGDIQPRRYAQDTPGKFKRQRTSSRSILEGDTGQRQHRKQKKGFAGAVSIFVPNRRSTSVRTNETRPTVPKIRTSTLFKKWWTTADSIRDEQGAHLIFAIRDFIVYIFFISLLWMGVYGHQYSAHNYYAKMVSDIITKTNFVSKIGTHEVISNFVDIHSPTQIWGFVDSILQTFFAGDIRGKILTENILVGAPLMRQIRVKSGTCLTAPMFEDLYKTCYDYYTEENEFKEPFGHVNYSAWNYVSDPSRAPSVGQVSTYGGGGYQMTFSTNSYFSQQIINELRNWAWLRLGTRAVIIDFTLYTPNANLFLVSKLIFEVLPTGGVTTRSYFTTSKFLKFLTPWDFFVQSCEFMLIIFTLYYTFEEVQQIWILRGSYMNNCWNILDLMIIILSYVTIVFLFYRSWVMAKTILMKVLMIHSSDHANFDVLLNIQEKYGLTSTMLTFVAWLKLFKFTSLYRSVSLFLSALGKVKGELLTVMTMTFVLITGFALCGLCLFGSEVKQFQGFSNSLFSLISVFVGQLSFYDSCHAHYPTLAQIYFSVYIIITAVFFFCTYTALIVYGFNCADVELELKPGNLYLSDLAWSFFLEILYFIRQDDLAKKLQKRDFITQNQEDYDAFCRILKRHGWQGRELELFVKTYGLERGEPMRLDKMTDMYSEICLMTQLFTEVESHNKIYEQLEKIDKLYEFCDQTVVDIMTKVNYLTDIVALNNKEKIKLSTQSE